MKGPKPPPLDVSGHTHLRYGYVLLQTNHISFLKRSARQGASFVVFSGSRRTAYLRVSLGTPPLALEHHIAHPESGQAPRYRGCHRKGGERAHRSDRAS